MLRQRSRSLFGNQVQHMRDDVLIPGKRRCGMRKGHRDSRQRDQLCQHAHAFEGACLNSFRVFQKDLVQRTHQRLGKLCIGRVHAEAMGEPPVGVALKRGK